MRTLYKCFFPNIGAKYMDIICGEREIKLRAMDAPL